MLSPDASKQTSGELKHPEEWQGEMQFGNTAEMPYVAKLHVALPLLWIFHLTWCLLAGNKEMPYQDASR